MNFLLNLVIKHVQAAVLENWKTTLCGVVVAILGVAPKLMPLFEGHSIDTVDWSTVGGMLASAVGLVLAKDFSLIKIIESAPRAQPVEK